MDAYQDTEAMLTNEQSAALAGVPIMSAIDGKRRADHVIVQLVTLLAEIRGKEEEERCHRNRSGCT